MQDKKQEKLIGYLALIPFLGVLIVIFYGAFKIKKYSENIFYVYGFLLFSVLLVSIINMVFIGLGYIFLFNENLTVRIVALVIVGYISYLLSALILKVIIKKILVRMQDKMTY